MPILSNLSPGAILADSPHYAVVPVCGISQQNGNDATRDADGGYDFSDSLTGFSITASMDNAMMSARIELALGRGPGSLSPLISTTPRLGSRAAIMPHNAIGIGVEIGPTPFALFSGRIDRVTIAGDRVILTCRDRGAYYQESMIRETATYGLASGLLAEVVMGQILTDNGWSPFDLYTPVSPDFALFPYPVGETGTLDALRVIAQQYGWDVRWFPGDPADLRHYDPGRTRAIPDADIDLARYEDVEGVEWGDEDVRNDWVLHYADPITGIATPRGILGLQAVDAASIALYGRRKARIFLNRAENIRTDAQGLAFLAAALADSKDPFVGHRIRMPLYPNVTLNDLHHYTANGREYDQDLTLAVVAYTHTWSSTPGTQAKTVIGARGKPLAAYREYRRSVPPKVIVTTVAPTDADYASEGTMILVTDSILP